MDAMPDLVDAARRARAAETMRAVDPARVEQQLREFMSDAAWSDWETAFTDFLQAHGREGLLGGVADEGLAFVFCPAAGAGFWVVSRPGLRGKGLLQPSGVAALTQIAREKGLFAG